MARVGHRPGVAPQFDRTAGRFRLTAAIRTSRLLPCRPLGGSPHQIGGCQLGPINGSADSNKANALLNPRKPCSSKTASSRN